jgi:putative spermidine/putrescine transport system permease protein
MGRFAKILFGVAAVVFLIAPLFAILPLAFTSSVFLTYPVPGWSVRWFEELATADVWRRAIVNSLIIGSGTTILATVLGTMAALGLRSRILFLSDPIKTLFLLPMVVPAVVMGVGMQLLFVRLGIANSYLGVIIRAYSDFDPLCSGERYGCSGRYRLPC